MGAKAAIRRKGAGGKHVEKSGNRMTEPVLVTRTEPFKDIRVGRTLIALSAAPRMFRALSHL